MDRRVRLEKIDELSVPDRASRAQRERRAGRAWGLDRQRRERIERVIQIARQQRFGGGRRPAS